MSRNHHTVSLKTKMTLTIMLLFGSLLTVGMTGHYLLTNPASQAQSGLALTACGVTLLTFLSVFISVK